MREEAIPDANSLPSEKAMPVPVEAKTAPPLEQLIDPNLRKVRSGEAYLATISEDCCL